MKRWEYLILRFSCSDKKIFCVAVMIGFLFTCCLCISAKDYSDKIQSGLSDKIMRLHVLANSDSDFDQELKLKVRDEILNKTNKYLTKLKIKTETRKFLTTNLEKIKKLLKTKY